MSTAKKNAVEEALATLGISQADLQAFVQQRVANKPGLVGQVNEGEERKYGEVSLIKVFPNGFRKPFGLSKDQAIAARDFLLEVYPLES